MEVLVSAACKGCRSALMACCVGAGAVEGGMTCCPQALQKSCGRVVALKWQVKKK